MNDDIERFYKLHPSFPKQDTIFRCESTNVNIISDIGTTMVHSSVDDVIYNSINNGIPLTMTRYNDGEWISLFEIDDYMVYSSVLKPKIEHNGGKKFVDEKILPIILNKPQYHIGISSQTLKHQWIMNKIYKYISYMTLFDGGLFSRWLIENKLNTFLDTLKKHNVILIGPNYLKKFENFFPYFQFVDTGDYTQSWVEYERIKSDVYTSIQKIESMPILLYCASFVGKVILDDVYNDYPNVIQFDMGSALDSYISGHESRTWHTNGDKI